MQRINNKNKIEEYINSKVDKKFLSKLCLNGVNVFDIQKDKIISNPKCKTEVKDCLFKKTLGSGSANGEAYKSCQKINGEQICLALKQIPMKSTDTIIKSLTDKTGREQEVWIEYIILNLCNYLVEQNICPNVPILYNSFLCDNCTYTTNDLRDGRSCLILANEFAEYGDGNNFFKRHFNDFSAKYGPHHILVNILFQVYAGLYALQKYYNITHHDLHMGNILFVKQKHGETFKYIIDGVNYYLPNLGFTVTLWDFGYSMMPGVLVRGDDFYREYMSNFLQSPDWVSLPRIKTDVIRITNAILSRITNIESELLKKINNLKK